jgi:hypothetical protein
MFSPPKVAPPAVKVVAVKHRSKIVKMDFYQKNFYVQFLNMHRRALPVSVMPSEACADEAT